MYDCWIPKSNQLNRDAAHLSETTFFPFSAPQVTSSTFSLLILVSRYSATAQIAAATSNHSQQSPPSPTTSSLKKSTSGRRIPSQNLRRCSSSLLSVATLTCRLKRLCWAASIIPAFLLLLPLVFPFIFFTAALPPNTISTPKATSPTASSTLSRNSLTRLPHFDPLYRPAE